MFENIGKKIKDLVMTIFFIEAIIFLVVALFTKFILLPFIGIPVAWITSFVLYGYGELIDCSQKQTKQNEKIIALLLNSYNKPDENNNINIVTNTVKTSSSTGFTAMNIDEE